MRFVIAFALMLGCEDEGCKHVESSCCKVCEDSKPCGDSCISRSQTCNVGPGCACGGFAVDAR